MQAYNSCDLVLSLDNDFTAGHLYLGDYNSARNKKLHRQLSISTVVTAGLGMKVSFSSATTHRLYSLYDSAHENIEKYSQGHPGSSPRPTNTSSRASSAATFSSTATPGSPAPPPSSPATS
jgi:hypothetical protein